MAINYTKIGWDTSKYVNPTNMNQMDNGIKAACDGVDAHDTAIAGCVKLSSTGSQRISAPNSVPLYISGNSYSGAVPILLRYEDESQNLFGGLGVTGDHKPTFFYNNTYKEIALKENTAAQENIGYVSPNTTTRFTIPSSILSTGAVYLIAVSNTYGVGSVYLFLRADALSTGYASALVQKYFTITAVSDTQFDVAAQGADGEVVITRLT